MTAQLTPGMRKVLALIKAGRDAYHGAKGQHRGGRARSIYACQKHDLIDNTAKGWRLTAAGKKIAKTL